MPATRLLFGTLALVASLLTAPPAPAADAGSPTSAPSRPPNLVYILADDLGYGDVGALNKDCKIKTSHFDRLASQGMAFTDAHSGSAVCTPTRYGILTGRYCWRTHLRSGVLWGYSPPLIEPSRPTVASLLKQQGYDTAAIGKWHLGWDWALAAPAATPPQVGAANPGKASAKVDFSKPIHNGPTARGFDHFFGIAASLDMPPYCFVEDDHAVGLPTATKTFYKDRTGPATPDFEAEDVLPTLTRKAVEYVNDPARRRKPYFLYLALTSPHTPIAPTAEFRGKSGINPYADFVMETDWAVGQVLDALEKSGAAGDTLVIFTSDNGCSPEADFKTLAAHGHHPSYVFRGAKSDIWESGHHIPFIARWPGHIKPAATCDDTICLTDLMATAAALSGAKVGDDAGGGAGGAEDSVNLLPDLLGTAAGPLREATVHQSIDGALAIRQGRWKLELCPGSGGWGTPKDAAALAQGLPAAQLYDMTQDVSERRTLQAEQPERVVAMTALLQKYVDEGRSTRGPRRNNEVPVPLRLGKAAKGDGGT